MKKKVLIYTDCYVFSGAENMLIAMAKHKPLNEKYAFKYTYAQSTSYRKACLKKLGEDYPLISLPVIRYLETLIRAKNEKNTLIKLLWLLKVIFIKILFLIGVIQLYNVLVLYIYFKKENPSVVFINNGGYPGAFSCLWAVFAAKFAGVKKIILKVNNMALPPKNFFERWMDKRIERYVHTFLTGAKYTGQHLKKTRKFISNKFHAIHTPLHNENLIPSIEPTLRKEKNIDADTIIIGSVGMLIEMKGYHILIDSISNIREELENNKVKVFIYGEGEMKEILTQKIARQNLQNIVHLEGYTTQVMAKIKDFDMFILPSISGEDFPTVVIEAMCVGLPVIASKLAGVPEQINHNETGLLVEKGNIKEYSSAILKLIEDKKLRKKLGSRAQQQYFNVFNYDQAMLEHSKIFG